MMLNLIILISVSLICGGIAIVIISTNKVDIIINKAIYEGYLASPIVLQPRKVKSSENIVVRQDLTLCTLDKEYLRNPPMKGKPKEKDRHKSYIFEKYLFSIDEDVLKSELLIVKPLIYKETEMSIKFGVGAELIIRDRTNFYIATITKEQAVQDHWKSPMSEQVISAKIGAKEYSIGVINIIGTVEKQYEDYYYE